MIIIAWLLVAVVFVGVSGMYYLYMKRRATKPWKLNINEDYQPSAAILVPVHNEEKTIHLKLQNLSMVKYPVEKIETIIVNDASTDSTLTKISQYAAHNPSLKINVFDNKEHLGKTECLNRALNSVNADIVIISDADCFWPSDILLKALPYLSDPNVGAITARELLLNPQSSWVTVGEQFYNSIVQSIRIGESKTHSTIIFQGGFAAYKRNIVNEFDRETDDSGTALNIVQKNSRALLIPEIGFYTMFPVNWKNKIILKTRRASQLQHLWAKCFMLLLHGKLIIPKKIAIPEVFLHIFNPLLVVVLGILSIVAFVQYPVFLLVFLLVLCPVMLMKKTRKIILEALQSNLILLVALSTFFAGEGFKYWKPVQESRKLLDDDVLRKNHLI